MNILGLSCYFHDAAACLIKNDQIIAAAQEERFNRNKYSSDFPEQAINYCLQEGNITINDIDYIGFYEKPYIKFSRLLINHLKKYPFSFKSFLKEMPAWLEDRLILPLILKKDLSYDNPVFFIKHHLSHASSAFLVSGFDEAAIITADSIGEWTTASLGTGRNNQITIKKEITFPNSLGLLYSAVTTFLGFKVFSGEGKVMGLSSYGKPVYLDKFQEIIKIKSDGSFRLNPKFFAFNTNPRMYSKYFIKTFGGPREPESKITQRDCDMAATLQKIIEDCVVSIAQNIYDETKIDNLCLAGGLFLNCVANYQILQKTPFKNIFIQPAAGDSGGALGVALYINNCLLNRPRTHMKHAFLGPSYASNQIEILLKNQDLPYKKLNDDRLLPFIAEKLSQDKIIGWFQGKLEFGPRALGNRSILANPCNPKMKDILNAKIKKREAFRPFAPAILKEHLKEYFSLNCDSDFMLLASDVLENKKEKIPGVTHVDGTARVQTVDKEINPRFWALISAFKNIVGVPLLINTSFNLRGEPIVCSPRDAITCFYKSEMDYLVLENFIVEKQ